MSATNFQGQTGWNPVINASITHLVVILHVKRVHNLKYVNYIHEKYQQLPFSMEPVNIYIR